MKTKLVMKTTAALNQEIKNELLEEDKSLAELLKEEENNDKRRENANHCEGRDKNST